MLYSSVLATLLAIANAFTAHGAPTSSTMQQTNALHAQALNVQFASLKMTDSCTDNDQACINNSFVLCADGNWTAIPCQSGFICAALPLVKSEGVTVTCDTPTNALQRMQDAGVDASLTGNSTVTSSVTLATTPTPTSLVSTSATATPSNETTTDAPDCTMMGGNATASPTAASAVTSVPVVASAPSAASTSSADGGDDEGCAMDGNVALVIPAASSSSIASAPSSGYTRQRYIVPAMWAAVASSSSGMLAPASTLPATALTPVALPTIPPSSTLAPIPTSTSTGEADSEDGSVLVVTIETTMYVTVTVPPSGIASPTSSVIPSTPSVSASFLTAAGSPSVSSSGFSLTGIPSAFPSPSTSGVSTLVTPTSLPSTAVPSGSVGASGATIAFTNANTLSSVSSVFATAIPSDNTGTFDSASFTGRVASTPFIVSPTPTSGFSAASTSLATPTSSLLFSIATILTPQPTSTLGVQQPVTTYDSSDLAYLLTASVTP